MMDELKGFTVPEFMIHKMKAEMLAQRTDSGRSKFERSRSGTPVEVTAGRLYSFLRPGSALRAFSSRSACEMCLFLNVVSPGSPFMHIPLSDTQ